MLPGLPNGIRAKVYRRIVDQLRTDPVLSSVVRHWNTFQGRQADSVPSTPDQVAVQLIPRLGPTSWASADSHRGAIVVQVEMWTPGGRIGAVDAEDALDLWEAFENAIYPWGEQAKRQDFEQDLRDLGCVTGQILFQQPAQITSVDDDGFYLLGSMTVEIQRQLDA